MTKQEGEVFPMKHSDKYLSMLVGGDPLEGKAPLMAYTENEVQMDCNISNISSAVCPNEKPLCLSK